MSPAGGGVVAGQDTSLAGDDITRLLGAGTLASPLPGLASACLVV